MLKGIKATAFAFQCIDNIYCCPSKRVNNAEILQINTIFHKKLLKQPFSLAFQEAYFHAGYSNNKLDIFAQANEVFISGNQLIDRWKNKYLFTIVETGFGCGCNFLATWENWKKFKKPGTTLHYVSIERYPFKKTDLAKLYYYFKENSIHFPKKSADQLVKNWPKLIPGIHRIEFSCDNLVLTLIFNDIVDGIKSLSLNADAFFLDGFSFKTNPDMWAPCVINHLARFANENTTFAASDTSNQIVQNLRNAGFNVKECQADKNDYPKLTGHFSLKGKNRRYIFNYGVLSTQKSALIIGAGVAGCAIAESLARVGWNIELIDQASSYANGASGNPAAIFHPPIAKSANPLVQLGKIAFEMAIDRWKTLQKHGLESNFDGLIQIIEPSLFQFIKTQKILSKRFNCLENTLTPVLSSFLNNNHQNFVVWKNAGWINPKTLCQALLTAADKHALNQGSNLNHNLEQLSKHKVNKRFNTFIDELKLIDNHWYAFDINGHYCAKAETVVIANSDLAKKLFPKTCHALNCYQGQITYTSPISYNDNQSSIGLPIIGKGYVIPQFDKTIVGASYTLQPHFSQKENTFPPYFCESSQCQDTSSKNASRAQFVINHNENISRLHRLLPFTQTQNIQIIGGRISNRWASSDHLPLIGAAIDEFLINQQATNTAGKYQALQTHPRLKGAYIACGYGSRGMLWSVLGAEIIKNLIEGEPLAISASLVNKIDPARFLKDK